MGVHEIDRAVREEMSALLEQHLSISAQILSKDKILHPMLMTDGCLIALQPDGSTQNVDAAYAHAVNKLRTLTFDYALFSYSTKIGMDAGKPVDAIKAVVIAENGQAVVTFTPFNRSGLIKKKVSFDQTILSEIIPNVFE